MGYLISAAAIILAGLVFYGDWVRLDSAFLQAAAVLSGVVFVAGFYSRVSIWATGRPGPGEGNGTLSGLVLRGVSRSFSPDCLFAVRLFRINAFRGVVLFVTIWSFLALFAGTVMLSLEYTLGLDLTSSNYFDLVMDVSGAALFATVTFYMLRRLISPRARSITVMEDHVILLGFMAVILTGFLLEGARMAFGPGVDNAGAPVGLLFAGLVERLAERQDVPALRRALFNIHALLALAFIAYIPHSKQFHMFAAQIVTGAASDAGRDRKGLMHGR